MAKFTTRARAIDMLGRQQIAGVPTAINELFKNAHDAYADRVEVDYFRQDDLFVLRDDGVGMTKTEFTNKWLVLGTDSKIPDTRRNSNEVPKGKTPRHILGEKGIGRLSIAAIGNQVLVLSRAIRNGSLEKIVASFINWGIFEIPGINLDQIEIPVHEFEHLPDFEDVKKLTDEFAGCIRQLREQSVVFQDEADMLIEQVEKFIFSPCQLNNKCQSIFDLESSSGTQFYVSNINPMLPELISNKADYGSTKMEKFLVGFVDTFSPNRPKEIIHTAFWDHDLGIVDDIIDNDTFFTPEDFQNADHHFIGEFDEYGQFSGTVTIYNKYSLDHSIPWNGNNFKKTQCGPFSIQVSYLQGRANQSTVDPISHKALTAKTDKFGGLYIYKDGIRLLPYGNSDFDFLGIEENRSKSASFYFFSYRRIIGVVYISKDDNSKLVEKAGREGLIENAAYKQFQDILKNFFVQLAVSFFREKGKGGNDSLAEYWTQTRREREKHFRALEKRNSMAKVKKDNFLRALNEYFERTQSKYWEAQVANLLEKTETQLNELRNVQNHDVAAEKLINIESDARNKVQDLKSYAIIRNPRGFALSREHRENWEAYIDQRESLFSNILNPADDRITTLVNKYRSMLSIHVNNKIRIQNAVKSVAESAEIIAKQKKKMTEEAMSGLTKKVRVLTQDLMEQFEKTIRETQFSFTSLDNENIEDDNIQDQIERLEAPINREKEYISNILENIIAQIDGVFWTREVDGSIITNQDIADSLEEEIDDLKQRIENDSELIQLGLAVNIIHHEFAGAVKALRSGLRSLEKRADVDKTLAESYKSIQTSFLHLDQYLAMLTPFSRRLSKNKEDIKAIEIYYFMLDVFRGRLERHNISLQRTNFFSQMSINGYRSVFYPVYTNIVDNAIHWLKLKNDSDQRIVRLHGDNTGALYISNNGPSIPYQDKERIFELGYSKKANGRGMGLTISKEVLKKAGYDIEVDEPRDGMTVTFKIYPIYGLENNVDGQA